MRVENKFDVTKKYLTMEDINTGECYRFMGDEENRIFLKTDDDYGYNLEDGKEDYNYPADAPVEKVIGHFVVDEIIHNVDKE